jgi:mannose-6-phosphate isomerase-like protein (cupin superfamily)
MRRAVIVAAIFAAFVVSEVRAQGTPAFTCRPEGRMFRCTAKNVDALHPQWFLRKRGGDYIAWGPTFTAYAPKAWAKIQMLVQTDVDEAWLVEGGEVRLWRGKAQFRCRPEANCFMGPK